MPGLPFGPLIIIIFSSPHATVVITHLLNKPPLSTSTNMAWQGPGLQPSQKGKIVTKGWNASYKVQKKMNSHNPRIFPGKQTGSARKRVREAHWNSLRTALYKTFQKRCLALFCLSFCFLPLVKTRRLVKPAFKATVTFCLQETSLQTTIHRNIFHKDLPSG